MEIVDVGPGELETVRVEDHWQVTCKGGNKMNEHIIFYYPYASFTNTLAPLLKAAPLYFDKLYILEPVESSWDGIGSPSVARDQEGSGQPFQ